jgi:hypothetical protein
MQAYFFARDDRVYTVLRERLGQTSILSALSRRLKGQIRAVTRVMESRTTSYQVGEPYPIL